MPEKVRAAHILVTIKDGNKDAALAKATDIRAKAVAGADFAKLAREFSDDPTVARNGGELGFFEAKSMDPAFAAAAFAMTTQGRNQRAGADEVRLPHHPVRGPPARPRAHLRGGHAGTDGGAQDQIRR